MVRIGHRRDPHHGAYGCNHSTLLVHSLENDDASLAAWAILSSIFLPAAGASAAPSLVDLLADPFFSVQLPLTAPPAAPLDLHGSAAELLRAARRHYGEEVVCSLGDGSRPGKGLKCEWATLRDGALVVGSTGKERTDDEGNIVHEGEMWCKAINPETLAVTSVDARPLYNALRAKAKCPQGKGYMIHESGRWSDVHLRWFFMPRKLSREPYDEVRDASKCVSLLLAAKGDGAEATCIARSLEPALSFLPLRGASDFFFIPNTNDTHLFITRTEETLDNAVTTFASVIDLAGNVLMAEQEIARGCKFEGACVVDGWLSGEASEAPACTCQVM